MEFHLSMPSLLFHQRLKGTLCRFLQFFLWVAGSLLSGTPSRKFQPLQSPQSLTSLPLTQGDHHALPGFPHFLYHCPESSSKQKAGVILELTSYFSCLRDCRPGMPLVHYLQTVVSYVFFSFLVVYSGRASLVPVTPSWLQDIFLSIIDGVETHWWFL